MSIITSYTTAAVATRIARPTPCCILSCGYRPCLSGARLKPNDGKKRIFFFKNRPQQQTSIATFQQHQKYKMPNEYACTSQKYFRRHIAPALIGRPIKKRGQKREKKKTFPPSVERSSNNTTKKRSTLTTTTGRVQLRPHALLTKATLVRRFPGIARPCRAPGH